MLQNCCHIFWGKLCILDLHLKWQSVFVSINLRCKYKKIIKVISFKREALSRKGDKIKVVQLLLSERESVGLIPSFWLKSTHIKQRILMAFISINNTLIICICWVSCQTRLNPGFQSSTCTFEDIHHNKRSSVRSVVKSHWCQLTLAAASRRLGVCSRVTMEASPRLCSDPVSADSLWRIKKKQKFFTGTLRITSNVHKTSESDSSDCELMQ